MKNNQFRQEVLSALGKLKYKHIKYNLILKVLHIHRLLGQQKSKIFCHIMLQIVIE